MFIEQQNLNSLHDYMFLLITEESSDELHSMAATLMAVDDATTKKNQLKYWNKGIADFRKIKDKLKESNPLMCRKLEQLFLGDERMDYCVQYYAKGYEGRKILGSIEKHRGGKFLPNFLNN